MLDDNSVNKELVAVFQQKVQLTEEELLYTFTATELKLLCTKYKCDVDMWKWNPVDELREKLQRDGRFKNRTPEYCLRLIAKGIAKHKKRLMYNPAEINELRKEEWVSRRRDYVRFIKQSKPNSLSNNKHHNEISNQNTPSEQEMDLYNSAEVYFDNETEIGLQTDDSGTQRLIENTELQNSVITSSDADGFDSNDIRKINVNLELCDNLNCNTDSLTLGTEDFDMAHHENIQSEDILSVDYAAFGKKMPLTSTQSQE